MIITIGLVNIHHCTKFQNIFFLVMRTFKIYSFNNCKVCNTIFYNHHHQTCISRSVAQLRLTLCDPVDCSTPGSSAQGISWARILEWVAISFSRRFS